MRIAGSRLLDRRHLIVPSNQTSHYPVQGVVAAVNMGRSAAPGLANVRHWGLSVPRKATTSLNRVASG